MEFSSFHDKNNNKRLLILIIFLRKVDFPFLVTTLGEETFRERKFCEEKNFRDKFSKMSSNDAFHENLTFANDYFKRQNLIIFRHIQTNLFQFDQVGL